MTVFNRLGVGMLLVGMAVLAVFAFVQYRRADAAEQQLGVDAGRVLNAVLTQARDLRVGRLTGVALARSENDGTVFHTEQTTQAPFAVSYFVDLRQIRQGDFRWDADRRIMTVRIPDVAVEAPAIDMSRARVRIKGIYVSRSAAINLAGKSSRVLATTATARAKSPENMEKMRASAVQQVSSFIEQPLAAAGIDGVVVRVLFPWEGNGSSEQWDRSRLPEEVLGGAR